jgi:DNA-binding NtrC family response regulator
MLNEPAAYEVLVADDDAAVRELLVAYLGERGLIVASTADGRAAVEALRRSDGRYRLVFTDIAMPGADGFAVLTAARAANPSAYVVMITGYASLDTAVSAVRLGAQDYLAKPFSLGQVDVILQQASARFTLEGASRDPAPDRVAPALASIDHRLDEIERQLASLTSLLAPSTRR